MIPRLRNSSPPLSNPWKRRGVFRCTHSAHDDFQGCVSPYHVLREKRCYPQGCLYFQWRCRRLDKGKTCKRKFTHVGRLCRGCREYEEEKIHQQPQLLLPPGPWLDFRRELEAFEDWFDHNVGCHLEFSADVAEVKPYFFQEIGAESRVRLRGFLAVLRESYVGRTRIDSPVYLRLSRSLQERSALREGDVIDGYATLKEDGGRIVLVKPRGIEVLSRGGGAVWDAPASLVARRTATTFRRQPERCLQCPAGTLLDVERTTAVGVQRYRRLMCMEGETDPECCGTWRHAGADAEEDR